MNNRDDRRKEGKENKGISSDRQREGEQDGGGSVGGPMVMNRWWGEEKVKPVSVGVVGTHPVLCGQMCGRAASCPPPHQTLLPKPTSLRSKTHSFIRLCSLLFLDASEK